MLLWWLLVLLLSTSRAQLGAPSSPSSCPSCALAGLVPQSVPGQEDEPGVEVVEAVKRHILSMLHLQSRPNVTRPVPRAALLNAIRKLHVGHVAEDGSVTMETEEAGFKGAWRGDDPDALETTEVITFAEKGSSGLVDFVLSKEGPGQSVVEQANVWLFLRLAKSNRSRAKVTIRLYQPRGRHQRDEPPSPDDDLLIAQKNVDTRRSGWHTFPVTAAVQKLLTQASQTSSRTPQSTFRTSQTMSQTPQTSTLTLRVSCPLCSDAGAIVVLVSDSRGSQREQSHRPFLMAVLRQGEPQESRRRKKRSLECDGKVRVCCKRQFYVNFKDIGWSDWIIAPNGYHANYCEGECPSHAAGLTGSSLSFHSTVIGHYRMRGYSPFQNLRSCCVPTRLRAMSMLYYDEEQKIIKKDIQNMIVEECGCS